MRDIYLRAKGRTVIWRGDMLDLIYHNTGAYTSMPQPRFGAKDVCYTEKKVANRPSNDSLLGRPACNPTVVLQAGLAK